MNILSTCLVTLSFLSCLSCSKKTTGTTAEMQTVPPAVQEPVKVDSVPENYRFTVSFYSIGAGSEVEQMQKFETFVADFNTRMKKKIEFEKSSWGREGEKDYCINLSTLSVSEQEQFIKEAKDVLKLAKWVNYKENSPCKMRPKRR